MNKRLFLTVALVFLCLSATNSLAQNLAINEKFNLERLSPQAKPGVNTIVAFMPSLTYDTEYASMMTQSLHYYYVERLAFEGLPNRPETRVILVIRDKQDESKSTQNIISGMTVIYDEKGEMFSSFAVPQPGDKNANSTVALLDANNKVVFVDPAYRSQGEHLKPLESKVRELNGMTTDLRSTSKSKSLKIGDKAPDFRVNSKEKLSDLRGTVVLLTFYPAAFSGTLPRPAAEGEVSLSTIDFKPIDTQIMTCIAQIDSLDKIFKPKKVKPKKDPRRIAITSSTPSLLEKWKTLLATQNVEYANDADYSVASSYSVINPAGYLNRVSIIVDQKGRIAHIDSDYSFADEWELNRKVEELLGERD